MRKEPSERPVSRFLGKIILALFLAMIASTTSAASQQIDGRRKSTLDSIVASTAITYDIPGVSVAIVSDSGVVYQKSYGVRDIDTQEPIDPNTIFRTGSISKVLTATAVMQLMERGLIDLDKPVYEYVPHFRMKDQDFQKITTRHLLTHTSGLPGDNMAFQGSPDFDVDAIRRYVGSLEDRPLEFIPGAGYSYSNTGYVLLSSLVEEVTKMPFEDYVRENILEPLGMHRSTFGPLEEDEATTAALHVIGSDFQNNVHESGPLNRWKIGAGGLQSTIGDMSLFAQALLNGGRRGEAQVISEESLNQMWEKGTGTGDKGLAWSVYSMWGGKKMVDHGGNSLGYSAEIALLPGERLAVIVLCNNRNGAEWLLASSMLKVMLDRELGEPRYYPDFLVQKRLREEGPDAALAYFERALRENKDDVTPYDMELLAYRLVQGGGESNLETSKAILELLAEYFPDDPGLDAVLGEVYFRLSRKYYQASVRKNPSDWASKVMLEQLRRVVLDFR